MTKKSWSEQKRNTGEKVSKILLSSEIVAASVLPGAKYISVSEAFGDRYSYIPNTKANRSQLDKKFGKPKINNYRGKGRKTWLDRNFFD